MRIIIKKVSDYELTIETIEKIQILLVTCFGKDYPNNRIFYKQIPHFRFLYFDENNELIGHIALDYRAMNLNGKLLFVMGISDVCVAKTHRNKKIGTKLIQAVEKFSEDKRVDFLLLATELPKWYKKLGFEVIDNECIWLKINDTDLTSLGLGKGKVNGLMIKRVSGEKWNTGTIDLLGHLY